MTGDRIIEKGTFYPNSNQGGACAPVASPTPAALVSADPEAVVQR